MTTDHSIIRTIHRLGSDRRGNFAMLFALMAVPVLAAAGMAVDVSQAFSDRSELAHALDAAVLSTSQAISSGDIEPEQAEAYLDKFFAGNLVTARLPGKGPHVSSVAVDRTTDTVSAAASYDYRSSFRVLGAAGAFPLTVRSVASWGDGTAEVAMTFDLTGSMADRIAGSGDTKIEALKAAAKSGIEKLMEVNKPGENRIRIASVPYAQAVNVGKDLAPYVYADNGRPNTAAPAYVDGASRNSRNMPNDNCATERKGDLADSDAGPEDGMINRDGRLAEGACPQAAVIPLTANENRLLNSIATFRAGGTTAGQIGIQWAWYMLAHSWANYIPGKDGAEAPADRLHKYAIIMTDGEFNTAYAGVGSGENVGNQPVVSSDDAVKLCGAMKADHIQIFTIGFNLTEKKARQTLQACASPSEGGMTFFYNAASGDELAGIYQEIAGMIQKLRLIS